MWFDCDRAPFELMKELSYIYAHLAKNGTNEEIAKLGSYGILECKNLLQSSDPEYQKNMIVFIDRLLAKADYAIRVAFMESENFCLLESLSVEHKNSEVCELA
jgi:hypothetical protein